MILDSMSRSLCNKMKEDFATLTAPINQAKSAVRNVKNQLQSLLNSMVFSPDLSAITDEVAAIQAAARALYPSDALSEMESLKTLLDACAYLDDAKPISSILGTTLGVFDEIDNIINTSIIPEIGAASLGDLINKLMAGEGRPGGSNLSDIFKKADKLINCLSAICGAGDPTYITIASTYTAELDNLYDSMGIDSNPVSPTYGEFDFNTIYDNAGMTPTDRLKVDTALSGVTNTGTNALSSISSSVSKAKSLIKTGFF
ncbi:MAG: hypothetical protein V3W20_02505 [Candidatus Neomarinimicrobiota bacterium]